MTYDGPKAVIAGVAILQLIGIIGVVPRLISRCKTGKKFLASDWLIFAAFILGIALSGFLVYGCVIDGLAISNADFWDFESGNFVFYVSFSIGIVASGFIQISVSLFCLRIHDTPLFRRIIYSWVTVIALFTFAYTVSFLVEEGNRLDIFNLSFGADMCGSESCAGWGYVITNLLTALLTLILSVSMACIGRRKMTILQQVAVVGMFVIGAISVGASMAKAYWYIRNVPQGYVIIWPGPSGSSAHGETAACVWNLVEIQVGILAASLPILSSLLRLKPQTRALPQDVPQRRPQSAASSPVSELGGSIIFSEPPPYEGHEGKLSFEDEKTEVGKLSPIKSTKGHARFQYEDIDAYGDPNAYELAQVSPSGSYRKSSHSRKSWV